MNAENWHWKVVISGSRFPKKCPTCGHSEFEQNSEEIQTIKTGPDYGEALREAVKKFQEVYKEEDGWRITNRHVANIGKVTS